MTKKNGIYFNRRSFNPWPIVIFVVGALFFLSWIFALIISLSGSSTYESAGNVLVIPINGEISASGGSSFISGSGTKSYDVVKRIDDAEKDSNIKGVLFEINSPGGTPVASHEIVARIKAMEKPNAALIRDVGASGAYWVASASDYIIADELSLTGSVGVFSSYLEFSGIMDDYNITYQRIVGGEYKDIGSPFRVLKDEERVELERKVKLMHDYFLNDVAESRNLSRQQYAEVKSGIFFIGLESLELGLIDEFGRELEAKNYFKELLGEDVSFARFSEKRSFFDAFGLKSDVLGFWVGKGISSGFQQESGISLK